MPESQSKPLVKIYNSTEHRCSGKVYFTDQTEEEFAIIQWDSWADEARAEQPEVMKITASVMLSSGIPVDAIPYTSTGNAHHLFAVIKCGKEFVVTRIDAQDPGS